MKRKSLLLILIIFVLAFITGCNPDLKDFIHYNQRTKELHVNGHLTADDDKKATRIDLTLHNIGIWFDYASNLGESEAKKRATQEINVYNDPSNPILYIDKTFPVDLEPGVYTVEAKAATISSGGKTGSEELEFDGYFIVYNYNQDACKHYSGEVRDFAGLNLSPCEFNGCIEVRSGDMAVCQAYGTTQNNTPTIENSCEGVFGIFLVDIKAALKAFRIIGPILVGVYTTVEYLSAVTNKDAEGLKKANDKLIKRFILLLLLFFLPLLIDLLLKLTISGDYSSCVR